MKDFNTENTEKLPNELHRRIKSTTAYDPQWSLTRFAMGYTPSLGFSAQAAVVASYEREGMRAGLEG